MTSTTTCNLGDVVLVPFPFTDQRATKKRPAVVVSSEAYNARGRDVILVAVTSRLLRPADAVGEFLLTDWQAADGVGEFGVVVGEVVALHLGVVRISSGKAVGLPFGIDRAGLTSATRVYCRNERRV